MAEEDKKVETTPPVETEEQMKARLDACNAELDPILQKHEFFVGSQAWPYAEVDGTLKIASKPVLISTRGQKKPEQLSKP